MANGRYEVLRKPTNQPIGERCVVEWTANIQAAPHAKVRFLCHPSGKWLKYLPDIVDDISDKENFLCRLCQ